MKKLKRGEIYSTSYRDIEHLRLNLEPFSGQYHDGLRAPVVPLCVDVPGETGRSHMSWFTRPMRTTLPSVSFEIGGWGHDGDTLDRVPVEATKRLEIPAQQVGRMQSDRRPQNGTIVLWKFRQDGERSLWRQHRDHVDGLAQPFQLCRLLPRRKISLGLLQCIRRRHQPHVRQCKQRSKGGIDAVGSREQDVGIKKDPVHGL